MGWDYRQETKEEFINGYADRSGKSPKQLEEEGYYAVRCHCERYYCRGWSMHGGPSNGE